MLYAKDSFKLAAAYELATKARKPLPDDPELAEFLGRLSYERKEFPRAIQRFRESARKRPLSVNSLFYLGMSQLQGRQKADARGVIDQALVAGLQEPLATEAKTSSRGSPARLKSARLRSRPAAWSRGSARC